MGITLRDAKLLWRARQQGLKFGRTLTLGRQNLHFEPIEWAGCIGDGEERARFLAGAKNGGPADALFRALGARECVALDASDYEGAELRADLNAPVPLELLEQYDVVLDGGTLEHVFNFPVALRSAMGMVRGGGSLILLTPANNLSGHGFYQFSPELFYGALSSAYGYRMDEMLAIELSPAHRTFSVADPAQVGERVTLANRWPVHLFVRATRMAISAEPLVLSLHQADYQKAWKGVATFNEPGPMRAGALRRALKPWVPGGLAAALKGAWSSRRSGFANPRHFKRVEIG